MKRALIAAIFVFIWHSLALAQSASLELTVATVDRAPFSFQQNDERLGFSMDLLGALADALSWDVNIARYDSFPEMLNSVREGETDLAIANISITSAREATLDFSQPIFESGLLVMLPTEVNSLSPLMNALRSADLLLVIVLAFLLLSGAGLIMWTLERRAQPYFDRPLNEAWFPSFWWALNLVVNGGFEERVPRTVLGRLLGVVLVISSLFVVSIFVAHITSAMTLEAIEGSVSSINDLYGQRVGTIEGSTAATYLQRRDMAFVGYTNLQEMITAFEAGALEAVVFDAPILSHYVAHEGAENAMLIGQVFMRENYGIAFQESSPLVEDVNQALLALREDGTYDALHRKWFGNP